MSRIEDRFLNLTKEKKKAFVAFLTAGYPNLKITEELIYLFEEIGVDIIELGIPYSDPLADGPTIQKASFEALNNKINISKVLASVKRLRQRVSLPICLLSYYNPIFSFGEERFVRLAHKVGVDGLLIPDLPLEEAENLIAICKNEDVDFILFVSPTTPLERIKKISRFSSGFIYYVSLTGVTGMREKLSSSLIKELKQIKAITRKKICVGFGVSNAEQIKKLWKFADGVIVGSLIIKKIEETTSKKEPLKEIVNFVESLIKDARRI